VALLLPAAACSCLLSSWVMPKSVTGLRAKDAPGSRNLGMRALAHVTVRQSPSRRMHYDVTSHIQKQLILQPFQLVLNHFKPLSSPRLLSQLLTHSHQSSQTHLQLGNRLLQIPVSLVAPRFTILRIHDAQRFAYFQHGRHFTCRSLGAPPDPSPN
jgi:hypothetical protein